MNGRILAVDDQRYFRELLEGMLTDVGFSVETAASGEEALQILDREPFDVIVTDLVMPGMSGTELVQELRTRKPGIKAVFMSAFPRELLLEQGRLEPGDVSVEKPFSFEDLAAQVRTILDDTART